MPRRKCGSRARKAPQRKENPKDALAVLPDPATDADALKLGTLSYPVKVGGTLYIQSESRTADHWQ